MTLAGCRTTQRQPAHAWVRLDALTPLHPQQRMITDIDHRLQTLAEQRRHLLGHDDVSIAPAVVALEVPSRTAVTGPPPAPTVIRHSQELRTKELAAQRRLLLQERERKYVAIQRALNQQYAQKLEDEQQRLAQSATSRLQAIDQKYALPLTNARLALKSAEKQQKPTSAVIAPKNPLAIGYLNSAKQQYADVQAAIAKARADVQAELAQKRESAREGIQREQQNELLRQRQALLQEYEQRQQALVDAFAGIVEPSLAEIPVMTTASPALPAGTLVLEAPEMAHRMQASRSTAVGQRKAALADIERTVAQLHRQRQELQRAIARDTREAILALAREHGYTIELNASTGPDITASARDWLHAYWPDNVGSHEQSGQSR